MDFCWALQMLRNGSRVKRDGWRSKDIFLYLVPGSTFEVNRAPLLGIYPEGTTVRYGSHIDMLDVDGICRPWPAPQEDLLARDWMLA